MMMKKLLAVFYISLMASLLNACASEKSRGGMSFENLDTNGDGKITLQEFIDKTPKGRRNLEDIFKKLDANGDSILSKEEFDARPNRRGSHR